METVAAWVVASVATRTVDFAMRDDYGEARQARLPDYKYEFPPPCGMGWVVKCL